MPIDPWRSTTLGEVLELKRGYDLPSRDRCEGPYPIVSSSGVSGYHSQAMAKGPGVVTGRYGTIGHVFYIPQDFWPLNTSLYVRDFKGNDPRFISYFLRTLNFLAYSDKAAVPGLNRNHLHMAEVSIPPVPEQKAIAAVLGTLDDKIEVNRNQARVLEGIARAVFRSWFVDFDPVRRAATGEPIGLPHDFAVLFPKRLVDSPIGEVPEGWKVGTLGELLSLSRDAIDPGEHPNEEFDHFSIPAFDAGQMPSRDRGATIKSQKFVVTVDCVLVSKLNPRTPRVWLPPTADSRRQVASTEFLVCKGDAASHTSREFVYCMTTSESLVEHLTTHASGTSNSHQRVRPQDFLSFRCVQPPAHVLRAFTQMGSPIFGRIAVSRAQSATLAAVRDALLPKLISGDLRIADAEMIIGRAGV
jgi:type I restriction enzyme S subunit